MPRIRAARRHELGRYPGKFYRYGGWKDSLYAYSPTIAGAKRVYSAVTSPIRYAIDSLTGRSRPKRRRVDWAAAAKAVDLRKSQLKHLRNKLIEHNETETDPIRREKINFYLALANYMQSHPEAFKP